MANPANDLYLLLILLTIVGLVFWLIWLLTTQHRSEMALIEQTLLQSLDQTNAIIDQNNAVIERNYVLTQRVFDQLDELTRLHQEQHRRGRSSSRVIEATAHLSTDGQPSSDRSSDPKSKAMVAVVPSLPNSSS